MKKYRKQEKFNPHRDTEDLISFINGEQPEIDISEGDDDDHEEGTKEDYEDFYGSGSSGFSQD